jgi:hypothetical protein
MNDVLTKVHGRPSGGHMDVNNILNKVNKGTTSSRQKNDIEKYAGSATPVQPVAALEL